MRLKKKLGLHTFNNKMKANPEKFQAIAIGKQTKQQNLTFTIDGNKIECESEVFPVFFLFFWYSFLHKSAKQVGNS
jgi:hypothetical protein